eukprot:m.122998 g.122998  ORF g.122998 m.122998 type:complete len:224 (+) comp19685_c1_seq2:271-942(+)
MPACKIAPKRRRRSNTFWCYTSMVALAAAGLAALWLRADRAAQLLATQSEFVEHRRWNVTCSPEKTLFPGCQPRQCGRFVRDGVVSKENLDALRKIAASGMALGGTRGGPTILDLHSGALSRGEGFVDVYKVAAQQNVTVFDQTQVQAYSEVKEQIQDILREEFTADALHLTKPTFFSNISSRPAITEHDEYWHYHVDKITYGSFHFTCLLYLNDFGFWRRRI